MNVPHRTFLLAAAWALLAAGACRAGAWPAPDAGPPAAREVRLSRGLSLTGITWFVEIREGSRGGLATGAMRVTTGDANLRGVERTFGCRAQVDVDEPDSWTCVVPFRRGAPDWTAALARLDALGVMAPPREPAPEGTRREVYACNDGDPWSLEVWAAGAVVVQDAQVCGPVSARRGAYEAGVDSVFDAIATRGRAR